MNNKNTEVIEMESQQKDWAMLAVQKSKGFEVSTQLDYNNAAELCKDIKTRIKQVEEYWKPLKEQASKTHKDLCAKEKQLLAPFTEAETVLKSKMVTFQKQKMEEERILREEQERWKREEAERVLNEAAAAAEAGKIEHSEFLVEVAEQTQNMVFEQPKQIKVEGTAVKKTWKARVINASLVPVEVMGTVIRPVDVAALDKLAKFVKGQSTIPGVEFYEDVNISVRG